MSPSQARPIKLVLGEPANQVQQEGKELAEQVYVPREKEVLVDPVKKGNEIVTIKICSADIPIKEIEGPIVIGNLH